VYKPAHTDRNFVTNSNNCIVLILTRVPSGYDPEVAIYRRVGRLLVRRVCLELLTCWLQVSDLGEHLQFTSHHSLPRLPVPRHGKFNRTPES
jgi:hypothetical protein